jgi:hypothetical protein
MQRRFFDNEIYSLMDLSEDSERYFDLQFSEQKYTGLSRLPRRIASLESMYIPQTGSLTITPVSSEGGFFERVCREPVSDINACLISQTIRANARILIIIAPIKYL